MLVERDVLRAALPGYSLGREIGRGAFGLVIAGRDRLGREVAVKVLPGVAASPGLKEAEAEARVLAGFDHPHVVRVFDFIARDGLALIVMELVDGGSLRGLGSRRLPVEAVCGLGLAVAGALGHAHERGVLHRDVKPSNLLLATDGTVKVTDFGIAKAFDGSTASPSRVAGTPEYMAPEQFTLESLRPSTDLYALGIILHELSSGQRPFSPAPSEYEGYRLAHLESPPAALPETVPRAVAAVVERMLAKDPQLRFPHARAFALALASAAAQAFGHDWLASCGLPVHVDNDVLAAATRADGTRVRAGHPRVVEPPLFAAPGQPVVAADAAAPADTAVPVRATTQRAATATPSNDDAMTADRAGDQPMLQRLGGCADRHSPGPAERHGPGQVRSILGHLSRPRRTLILATAALVAALGVGIAAPLVMTADARPSPNGASIPPTNTIIEPADVARRVAGTADSLRGRQPDLARRLALAAYQIAQVPDAAAALLASVAVEPVGGLLAGHTAGVNAVAFSPDGNLLASASVDHAVRLWDVRDPTRATPLGGPLTGHQAGLAALAFSPDGATLASAGDDGTMRLWDVRDPAHATLAGQPLAGHADSPLYVFAVKGLAFSPDGRVLAAGGNDRTVRLWDVGDPARAALLGQPLAGHTGDVLAVVFSPDGHTLASAGEDRAVRLWDVRDPGHPTLVGRALDHPDRVSGMAFSPDGRVLASAVADGSLRLWDVREPARTAPLGQPLTGPTAPMASVGFGPAGQVMAGSSYDSTVWLWDVRDPARTVPIGEPLRGHTKAVRATAFSTEGTILASASTDGTVRLWDLDPEHLFRRACSEPANQISRDEWTTYVPALPFRPVCE